MDLTMNTSDLLLFKRTLDYFRQAEAAKLLDGEATATDAWQPPLGYKGYPPECRYVIVAGLAPPTAIGIREIFKTFRRFGINFFRDLRTVGLPHDPLYFSKVSGLSNVWEPQSSLQITLGVIERGLRDPLCYYTDSPRNPTAFFCGQLQADIGALLVRAEDVIAYLRSINSWPEK
jgi:hypothetical protein